MYYKKNTTDRDYQQELTDKFIKKIEEAIEHTDKGLKWEKPFFTSTELPRNALTGEKYKGTNATALLLQEYEDPRWATFAQIKELSKKLDKDLYVRKGEKSSYIVKVIELYEKDKDGNVKLNENGKPAPILNEDGTKKISFKWFPVFNASQIEGMEPYINPNKKENKEVEHLATVKQLEQALIERTGLTVYHDSTKGAFYRSSEHAIYMPRKEDFNSTEGYADTFLHEAGHSTGNALGRKLGNAFGSKEYAFEELVAELSSSFMSVELGIPHNPSRHEQHAAYLKSWLSALQNDKTMLMKASNQASKATEYQINHLNEYIKEKDLSINKTTEKQEEVKIDKSILNGNLPRKNKEEDTLPRNKEVEDTLPKNKVRTM